MRLTREQWMLLAGFLTATAGVIASLDQWADLQKPSMIAALAMQIATAIRALYAPGPDDPNTVSKSSLKDFE